jgi:hypothetical protein
MTTSKNVLPAYNKQLRDIKEGTYRMIFPNRHFIASVKHVSRKGIVLLYNIEDEYNVFVRDHAWLRMPEQTLTEITNGDLITFTAYPYIYYQNNQNKFTVAHARSVTVQSHEGEY